MITRQQKIDAFGIVIGFINENPQAKDRDDIISNLIDMKESLIIEDKLEHEHQPDIH